MPPAQKPAVLATPDTPIKKAPTFTAKVKGLIPAEAPITVPYNQRDVEMSSYTEAIKRELSKKYGGTWTPSYKKDLNTVITHAAKAPDALVYLKSVLQILNPSVKLYTGEPGQKVKPGQLYGLQTPNIELSPTAQALIPTPKLAAKKKALEDKIAVYKAEIARLKAEQEKANKGMESVQNAKEKIVDIDKKLLKYFSYIEHHCKEYLQAVRETGKFLYRGQDDVSMPIFVGYPRENRKPKDSDLRAQKLADKCLTLMGFKALRSNSIFTSANFDQASEYGDVYAIFPKDGFNFTWSTKHDDLIIDSDSVGDLTGDANDNAEETYYEYEDYYHSVSNALGDNLNDFFYDTMDYDPDSANDQKKVNAKIKAVESSPEYKALMKAIDKWGTADFNTESSEDIKKVFLLFGEAYPPFAKKFPDIAKVISISVATLKKDTDKARKYVSGDTGLKDLTAEKKLAAKVVKEYGFTHKNLAAALKNNGEVCILGEYIAVDYDRYGRELRQYFIPPKEKAKKAAPKSLLGKAKAVKKF